MAGGGKGKERRSLRGRPDFTQRAVFLVRVSGITGSRAGGTAPPAQPLTARLQCGNRTVPSARLAIFGFNGGQQAESRHAPLSFFREPARQLVAGGAARRGGGHPPGAAGPCVIQPALPRGVCNHRSRSHRRAFRSRGSLREKWCRPPNLGNLADSLSQLACFWWLARMAQS